MPVLIKYSKSKYHNKNIIVRFCIKQALKNNIMLFCFNLFAFNFVTNVIYSIVIIGLTLLSILLSILLMYHKCKNIDKRRIKTRTKILKLNPLIKSTVHDYLTPNFLSMLIFCTALFLIIVVEITKDINLHYEIGIQLFFFISVTILFSVGFAGIIDSVPSINWKFQAIISPNDFKYHIKRSIFFLGGIYGFLLVFFIIVGIIINPPLLFKYLYCVVVLFFITINIAFTVGSVLVKTITLSFVIALTIWISTLPVVFLSLLTIPLLGTFIKAKNEYREWSLL